MYSQEVTRRVQQSLNQLGSNTSSAYIENLTKVQVMDLYLQDYGEKISPEKIRSVILEIFGINLEGISALEKLRISVFSKGQWIAQKPKDLFVVHAGAGDIDVRIYATPYFKKSAGYSKIPESLREKLEGLGYSPLNEKEEYYYRDPSGQSVPMEFKDQTIAAIGEVVQLEYKHI
ncbi:hypothetical protein [Halobacillus sp. Marseille-Q1614]|uniref:hypothetical protein n=1 Tax=Halobacillus sp. Marseille-Q1614 TaxID=2709134 RepID=UPI00156F334D|nr:hypothetical protein [Halobacillus sp. Marseille-Q1614]